MAETTETTEIAAILDLRESVESAVAGRGPVPVPLHFVVPRPQQPIGGVIALYSFAEAMARRGNDVHLHHTSMSTMFGIDGQDGDPTIGPTWFPFDQTIGVDHRVASAPEDLLGSTGIVFAYAEMMEDMPDVYPATVVQGAHMIPSIEQAAFEAPCPKVCLARWLVDELAGMGVPRNQLTYVPYGLDLDKFRVTTPIQGRSPLVSFCHSNHRMKGADTMIRAFESVRERRPDVQFAAFGARPSKDPLPEWIDFHLNPDQDFLVEEIYNRSTVFVMGSRREGFGYPSVESMACGAALVCTDNGGSQDYVIDGETALLVPPEDPDAMTDAISSLLNDESERLAMVRRGGAFVRATFGWERSAAELEAFCHDYLADPVKFGRPAR